MYIRFEGAELFVRSSVTLKFGRILDWWAGISYVHYMAGWNWFQFWV